jgi:membrane associated rhomboid family serine protease
MRPISERLSPTIRNLIIAEAVVFGLYIMAAGLRPAMTAHLALGRLFVAGEFWQPLSSLFVHIDLWSFVFDLIGLWFVGATIERALGRRRFLLMFFGAGLGANVVAGLLMAKLGWLSSYAGCGDSVLAMFVALGVIYGKTQVRVIGTLVLEARLLAGILVGMAVLSALLQQAWPALAGSLVAIGIGYLLGGGSGKKILAFLTRRARGGLRVLDGGRKKGGKNYVN